MTILSVFSIDNANLPGRRMESEIESTPSQCPSILAAIYKSGGLGAAIFDGSTGLIRIMEDLRSYSSGAMLEQSITVQFIANIKGSYSDL